MKDIENEIPTGWAWCRLGEIADIARGSSPRPIEDFITDKENGINWIKIGDTAPESKYIISAKDKIRPEGKKYSRFVHAGDFLLTNSMSFGRPYILKIDGCIHDGWLVFTDIRNSLLKDFLYYALSSQYIYNSFSLVAAGSTVKNLKADTVKRVLFPLPPLAEQQRIVSTIEAIFTQIDLLEQNKIDLQTTIEQAKRKILDLAIHGKLVPQDPADEPASVMLERLRAEKEAKIAAGEIKRSKNDSYIYKNPTDNCYYQKYTDGREEDVSDEIPFEVPNSWTWCRLGEICEFISRGKTPIYAKESKYPVLAQKCNQWSGIILDNALFLDPNSLSKWTNEYHIQHEDIVINSTGTGTIGRIGIFDIGILRKYSFIVPDSHISVVRCYKAHTCQKYIYNVFRSEYLQNQINEVATGSTNQKELPIKVLIEFFIPLPPLSEQQRIVAKIEALFTQLDLIKDALTE